MSKVEINGAGFLGKTEKLTPFEISESHELRSEYMRQLITRKSTDQKSYSKVSNTIPPTIIQYWDQKNAVPEDVQVCMDSWEIARKYGFEHITYNSESAKEFIKNKYSSLYVRAYEACMHPAMRCDYFRLCYLLECGGFYIDADDEYSGKDISVYRENSDLKLQPLCFDLRAEKMVSAFDSAVEESASSGKIFYVNNNPIISPKNHPVLQLALDRATKGLLDNRDTRDIQDITGPGNLSYSLTMHSIESERSRTDLEIDLILEIEYLCRTVWELEYRNDERNWRLWIKPDG